MPHFTLEEHFGSVSVAQCGRAARSGNTSTRFRRPTVPRRTPGEHFCPIPSPNSTTTHARATLPPVSVAQGCHAARSGDTYARFLRPTVHYHTLGRHFCPISVAQRCRAARSGNTSAPFRRPMVPRRTPGRHLRPFPSPNGAAPHARATPTPVSVAQRCRAARSGNISATIRHPTGHYHTLGRHFCPVPSPNSTTTHARATLTSNSVAQRCRGARSGNTSAPFRRPTVHYLTLGEHFCPVPSPNGAA